MEFKGRWKIKRIKPMPDKMAIDIIKQIAKYNAIKEKLWD